MPWTECNGCGGTGRCSYCAGKGLFGSRNCPKCDAKGYCPKCGGRKGWSR